MREFFFNVSYQQVSCETGHLYPPTAGELFSCLPWHLVVPELPRWDLAPGGRRALDSTGQAFFKNSPVRAEGLDF